MGGGGVEPELLGQAGHPHDPADRAGERDRDAELGAAGGRPALDGQQAPQRGAVAEGGDGEVGDDDRGSAGERRAELVVYLLAGGHVDLGGDRDQDRRPGLLLAGHRAASGPVGTAWLSTLPWLTRA